MSKYFNFSNQKAEEAAAPAKSADAAVLIPEYDSCDEATKKKVDEIIATIDLDKLESAITFGEDATKRFDDVIKEIGRESQSDFLSTQNVSIQAYYDAFSKSNLEKWHDDIKGLAEEKFAIGKGAAKGFLRGLFGGAASADKKIDPAKRSQERNALEEKLRNSILQHRGYAQKLQITRMDLEKFGTRIKRIDEEREVAFESLVLYMVAGRELVKRVRKANAEDESRPVRSGDDVLVRRDKRNSIEMILQPKLAVLLQLMGRNIAAHSVIATQQELIEQCIANIDFLIHIEAPLLKEQFALAGRTLHTLQTVDLLEKLEKNQDTKVSRTKNMAEKIKTQIETGKSEDLTDEGRDAMIRNLEERQQSIESNGAQVENFRKDVAEQLKKLQSDTIEFTKKRAEAQLSWARDKTAGTNGTGPR